MARRLPRGGARTGSVHHTQLPRRGAAPGSLLQKRTQSRQKSATIGSEWLAVL